MIDPIKLGKAVELSMESWKDGYRKGIEDAAKVVENFHCKACNESECQYNLQHYPEAIRALLDGGK